MLRYNVDGIDEAELTKSYSKIRKRCALSSSGASNPLRKLRLKRGVLLGRRGGGGVSPCSSRRMSELSWNRDSYDQLTDEMRSTVSARKLVSALWQLNKDKLFEEEITRDATAHRSLVPRRTTSMEFSKRPRTKCKAFEADGERRWHNGHGRWCSDMMSTGSTMEVNLNFLVLYFNDYHNFSGLRIQNDNLMIASIVKFIILLEELKMCSLMIIRSCSQDVVSTCRGEKTISLHDLYNSLIASKEIVKVLANIWGPEELNPSTVSLLSALRSDLNHAHVHVRQLIKEQKRHGSEVEGMKKQLIEEMEAWKSKQKEKVATTLQHIVSELDNEKNSRRRAERVNKKLGKALADTEASLKAATKELERERRSRERVEKICNELIRGIGVDKAEIEDLKRETEKAQEELEKEREMLHLADELREERVQMKLLEARFQFEEKNAVIDQLRHELEVFLETKNEQEHTSEHYANDQMQLSHASEDGVATAGVVVDNAGEVDGGHKCEINDSEGSDTHSIELNMDGNSKSYSWSYTASTKDMKRNASRHGSFSDNGMAGAILWGCDRKSQEMDDELEGEWDEGCSNGTRDFDQDAERYQAIKNLRDQMLAGSGFILSQDQTR